MTSSRSYGQLDDERFDDAFWGADCEACKQPRWHHSSFCSAIHMSGHYWRLGAYDERERANREQLTTTDYKGK